MGLRREFRERLANRICRLAALAVVVFESRVALHWPHRGRAIARKTAGAALLRATQPGSREFRSLSAQLVTLASVSQFDETVRNIIALLGTYSPTLTASAMG